MAFVQTANSGVPSGANASKTATFASAQTAGNTNIVVVQWGNGSGLTLAQTVSSVTDSKGNIYTLSPLGNVLQSIAGGNACDSCSVYYCSNILAATAGSNVVTATLTGTANFLVVGVLEYSGLATSSAIDVSHSGFANGPGATTAATSGAATTTNANDTIIGVFSYFDAPNTPGSGFTARVNVYTMYVEDKVVTSTGSQTATATAAAGGSGWTAQMLAFKAAGGTSNALVGTCTAHASNSAALLAPKILVGGNNPVDAANSASLLAPKLLAGTDTGHAANSAKIFAPKLLVATDTGRGANSASLFQANSLLAFCTVHGSESGKLSITKPLRCTCQGKAANSARLTQTNQISEICNPHGSIFPTLAVTKLLAGICTVTEQNQATLISPRHLVVTCHGSAANTATLSAPKRLAAVCTVQAINAGNLGATIPLGGTCHPKGQCSASINTIAAISLFATCTIHGANSGDLKLPNTLAAQCLAHGNSSGNIGGAKPIRATCTAQAANTAWLRVPRALVSTCTGGAASSGIMPINPPLEGACLVEAANSADFIVIGPLSANAQIFGNSSGSLVVSILLGNTDLAGMASAGEVDVTKPLEAFCLVVVTVDPEIQQNVLFVGEITLQGIEQATLTSTPGVPVSPTMTGIGIMRSEPQMTGTLFVPSSPTRLFFAAACEVELVASALIRNTNALRGTGHAQAANQATLIGNPISVAGTCTVQGNSTGTVGIVPNPTIAICPVVPLPLLPIITDIEQMPVVMLIAYCVAYELPTSNLQRIDLVNNLKALRWIMQGDAHMVTAAELSTLWIAYQIDISAVNVEAETMAILLIRFIFNLVKRHNAWGFSASNTAVANSTSVGASHSSAGLCLINVSVTSAV